MLLAVSAGLAYAAVLWLVYIDSPLVLLTCALWLLSLGLAVGAGWPRSRPGQPAPTTPPAPSPSLVAHPPWAAAAIMSRLSTARLVSLAGVLVAAFGQFSLWGAENAARPSRDGLLALLLGAVLFAAGSVRAVCAEKIATWPPRLDTVRRPWHAGPARRATAVGLALLLALLYRLANGSTAGSDLLLWFAALAAFTAPFLADLRPSQLTPSRRFLPDIVVVVMLAAIFIALNLRDMASWYYSVIGDEYAFYVTARDILVNGISRPFSQAGVYGTHPVINSVYQALVMAIFGQDNVGWKLASVLSVAIAIPGIYLIGLTLGGRGVAAASAIFFACSHYLFAYAHTGYNNIHALAPTVWALAPFILGLQRASPLLLYLAGLTAGLGFYTFFSARAAMPIMVLFVLTQRERIRHLLALWPVALGFTLAVSPMVIVNRWELLSRMVAQAPGGYSSDITGPIGQRIIANIALNLPAFNYNLHGAHYTSGSLLDPLTALLAALGVLSALRFLHHEAYRFLAIWTLVAFAATGLLSPYPEVAVSRLHFCLPPLVLVAGFTVQQLGQLITLPAGGTLRRWAGAAALLALFSVVLELNLHRFWIETPGRAHLSPDAVAIGALRSDVCRGDPERTVVVARGDGELTLKSALMSYNPGGPLPRLLDYDALRSGQPLAVDSTRCVIFTEPNDGPVQSVLEDLKRRYPDGRLFTFTDWAGKGRVAIFARGAGG